MNNIAAFVAENKQKMIDEGAVKVSLSPTEAAWLRCKKTVQ